MSTMILRLIGALVALLSARYLVRALLAEHRTRRAQR